MASVTEANQLANVGQREEYAPATKTVFNLLPSKVDSHELSFPVSAVIGGDQAAMPNFSWSVFSTPLMVAFLGLYESVVMDSASFDFTLSPGIGNAFYAAITEPAVVLKTFSHWARAPVLTIVRGSADGATAGSLMLPSDTSFAREYAAVVIGNKPPLFQFAYEGDASGYVLLRGRVSFTVSGRRTISHTNIGGDYGAQMHDIRGFMNDRRESLNYSLPDEVPAASFVVASPGGHRRIVPAVSSDSSSLESAQKQSRK